MVIRKNQPIQYRITLIHEQAGLRVQNVVNYGFTVEPTPLKIKVVALNIEQGLRRTIRGLVFVTYTAERIGK